MKIAIYTRDEATADMLRGIAGQSSEVVTSTKNELLTADLVLVDLALPRSADLLASLIRARQSGRLGGAVLAAMSASPFAIASLRESYVDALIAKPLHVEAVQALLVGVSARHGT